MLNFSPMNNAPSPLESRAKLIFTLRNQGIRDAKILEAFEKVDRSVFIDGLFKNRAWDDLPLTIPCGQSISAPSIVARMTQALQVNAKSKVLEIGTGSGYQTAILSHLVRRVYTVERHQELAKIADARFKALNIHNITSFYGDGSLGLPKQAPFDRILLTAASEDLPSTLLAQLKLGGIMVLPVGQSDAVQTLIRVKKTDKGLEYEELGDVRFVPLLPGRS